MTTHRPTIVFAGGGTGGHLFPGIAVAEQLAHILPDMQSLFVGSERAIESEILSNSGFDAVALPLGERLNWRRNPCRSARSLVKSTLVARKLLASRQTRLVVGSGGFASVPTVLAAASRRLPVVLLEQNAVAGRATRMLSRFSDLICISYDECRESLPERAAHRIELTGNPVRSSILVDSIPANQVHDHPESSSGQRTLLVLGGSQGAHAINEAVCRLAEREPRRFDDWRIIHQTGPDDVDRVRRRYQRQRISAEVAAFINEISKACAIADLVVTRGGATTLAELACCGRPMLIVPYPHAVDDHQTANARFFSSRNAARLLEETSAGEFETALLTTLSELMDDTNARLSLGRAARQLAYPDAANTVAQRILALVAPATGVHDS